jgi:hypothetical protein
LGFRVKNGEMTPLWTPPEVKATGPTGVDDGTGGYMPLAIVKGAASDINWVHSHHNAKPILLTNSTGAADAAGSWHISR